MVTLKFLIVEPQTFTEVFSSVEMKKTFSRIFDLPQSRFIAWLRTSLGQKATKFYVRVVRISHDSFTQLFISSETICLCHRFVNKIL